MKHIGTTTEGNNLVELSEEEYAELVRLRHAVEGVGGLPLYGTNSRVMVEFDFAQTFHVITAWWVSKLNINEMQSHLDAMKRSLDSE